MSNDATTSYFLDAESAAEMARLIQLDMFLTKKMGGLLAEQANPARFSQILDIGCGPGGWVLDVAYTYSRVEVAGIDVSKTMIGYANARARSQGIANASFEVMDASQPLAFSDSTFDLVNERFLAGSFYRAVWPGLLKECFRVTQPGGILRMTELDTGGETTSAAFNAYGAMLSQAMKRARYGFSPDGRSNCITPYLPALLRDAGYRNVQLKPHVIDFSIGTDIHMSIYRNYEIFFKLIQPLIVAVGVATQEELDRAYSLVLIEMQQDDFKAMWYMLTAWGEKPMNSTSE
jgi:ubiquinone/menaquinone biosynthesis C-methylase UbiE